MHPEQLQMLAEKIHTPLARPCHRVICSNGDIGGYSAPGGAEAKRALLRKESS
jgi:O6-methylguanine-DNA--protein-cysteine methyltransferase